jgi:L-seryl-tRNA(Ser) seleniumtransferase
MGVYESLGLKPIINAAGAVTRLGGAPMPETVREAYQAAADQWVPLEELQGAASRVIAQVTGSEAGIVTGGAAAALTLGAAAIITRLDLARMEKLPFCEGFPHDFVVARAQRNGYDHAVRAAGARLVEVGMDEVRAGSGVRPAETWEFEAAFNDRTAGVLYVFTPDSQPPLEEVVELAHDHHLPILVDAAAQLPPRANLLLASVTGADLVVYSGGKAIRGPQSTGILCGRRDLIAAAALQSLDMDELPELWDPPATLIDRRRLPGIPRHGIGRSMKVAKEEIVALLTALAMFANGEYEGERSAKTACLQGIAAALSDAPVRCELLNGDLEEGSPLLEVLVQETCTHSAVEVCRRLRHGNPPIYVRQSRLQQGRLLIDPLCLTADQARVVADRLRDVTRG